MFIAFPLCNTLGFSLLTDDRVIVRTDRRLKSFESTSIYNFRDRFILSTCNKRLIIICTISISFGKNFVEFNQSCKLWILLNFEGESHMVMLLIHDTNDAANIRYKSCYRLPFCTVRPTVY